MTAARSTLQRPPPGRTGDPGAARAVAGRPPGSRGVLDRIAHELLEKTGGGGEVVLLGIPTRGTTLASRLAARLHAFAGVRLPNGQPGHHALPRRPAAEEPRALEATDVPGGGIDGKLVVLVDDVLFSRPQRPGRARRPGRPGPTARRAARRPRRPGPPRAAHPGGLRRQEHPHLAPGDDPRAAHRARRQRRRAARPRRRAGARA